MANPRLCSIPDCGKEHQGHGFCNMHYQRFCKHGDPLKTNRKTNTKQGEAWEFYLSVVLPYDGNECLIWPYDRGSKGYGRIKRKGRAKIVSRMLCEDIHGSPPTPEHEAAHSCGRGNLGCVTKRHLSWKTSAENKADMIAHGTHLSGEIHPSAKLTEAQAREILSLRGKEPAPVTAARFGIARTTVTDIQIGQNWAFIGTPDPDYKHNFSKLTEEEAREILSLKGKVSRTEISSRFGVAYNTVSQIHRGERWSWLHEGESR